MRSSGAFGRKQGIFQGSMRIAIVILLINVVVFLLQTVLGDGFTEQFILKSEDVMARPWILLTSMFLHAGPSHIILNMWALFMFGPMLEERIGSRRFLALYLVSGLMSAFLSSFFYSRALGASGAIMGVIGVVIMLMPNLRILFYFFIPMPLWIAGIIIAVLDAMGIIFPAGVGNIAHLVGLAVGLGYGYLLRGKRQQFNRKFTSKKHLEEEDLDEYLRSGRI